MRIYMESCCLYSLDRRRAFSVRYMVENPLASQEHRKHDENNVKHGDNVATKS